MPRNEATASAAGFKTNFYKGMATARVIPLVPGLRIFEWIRSALFAPSSAQDVTTTGTHIPTFMGSTALSLAARSLQRVGHTSLLAPSYHCGHEIEPFLRANMKVTLYRVDEHGQVDLNSLDSLLTGRGEAVLITHYFGFPQDVQSISTLCKEKNAYLIEDCAHAFLSNRGNIPLGSWGDISIFSYRKSLPIPDGGALIISNPEIPVVRASAKPRRLVTIKATTKLLLDNYLLASYQRSALLGHGLTTVKRLLLFINAALSQQFLSDRLNTFSPDDLHMIMMTKY